MNTTLQFEGIKNIAFDCRWIHFYELRSINKVANVFALNKLNIKYQSHLKSTKINVFE